MQMEWTSRLTSLLKTLQHITSCKAIFYLITYTEQFKLIHKCELYIMHIILNLHRYVVMMVVVAAVVVVVVVAVIVVYKNYKNTYKWKWNMLQTKPVHGTITKQQYT